MFKKNIVLFGAGGHAISCIDVIEATKDFKILGIYDESAKAKIDCLLDYKILGCDSDFLNNPQKNKYVLISFGFIKNPIPRLNLIGELNKLKVNFATVLSPHAYISKSASIGSGTIVMHGSIINSGSRIGENCIVNSNTLIEHGSRIKSNCHISTGAIINGDVNIGENTFIGSGAIIFPGVNVPNNSVIPAGSVIKK